MSVQRRQILADQTLDAPTRLEATRVNVTHNMAELHQRILAHRCVLHTRALLVTARFRTVFVVTCLDARETSVVTILMSVRRQQTRVDPIRFARTLQVVTRVLASLTITWTERFVVPLVPRLTVLRLNTLHLILLSDVELHVPIRFAALLRVDRTVAPRTKRLPIQTMTVAVEDVRKRNAVLLQLLLVLAVS